MTRFFVKPEQISDTSITFGAEDAHHMFIVTKMRVGSLCTALDNTGHTYEVEIEELGRSHAVGRITKVDLARTEPHVKVTVAQALPRTLEKLEWVLEHGTEIGVSEFIIFSSERARENAERFKRKLDRWNEIVKTASEQSGRAILPTVTGIVNFQHVVETASSHDLCLMAYERETRMSLRQALCPGARSVLSIIGPEGGFTDAEVELARGAHIATITLGPRILRTETAGLSMVSQILFALDADGAEPASARATSVRAA